MGLDVNLVVVRHEAGPGMRESGVSLSGRQAKAVRKIDRLQKEEAAPGYQVQRIITQTLKIKLDSTIVMPGVGGYLGNYDTGSWFEYPYHTTCTHYPPAENERKTWPAHPIPDATLLTLGMHVTNLGYLEDGPPRFTELPDGGTEESNRTLVGLVNDDAIQDNNHENPVKLIGIKSSN